MSSLYQVRPSELVGLDDAYEAFCFDEACAFIRLKVEAGEEPRFTKKYASFAEIYKSYK